ncbi:uncharacterized protein LOC141628658 [Silene latifolia]|uniref:uncharacterized protein LOC141628658 n=1 Tax=Silene latifolia TaxID=37657 RepID=UPI003D77BC08
MAMENPFTSENNNIIATPSVMERTDPLYLHPAECAHPLVINTKLSGIENYLEWKRQMEIAICSRRKVGFLTGGVKKPVNDPLKEATWETCNSLLINWIHQNVEKSIKKSVLYTKTAKEIWDYLQRQFSVSNGARKFRLNKELEDLEQGEKDICEYFTELSILWQNLEQMCDWPPVTQEVAAMFQHEEAQRRNYKTNEKVVVDNSAFYVGSGSGLKEKDPNMSFCTACKKKGHVRENCWRIVGYPADHPVSIRFPEKSVENKSRSGPQATNQGNYQGSGAKQYRTANRSTEIFDLVHVDIWGPYRKETRTKHKYFLTLVDDHSRATWVYLMHNKFEAAKLLMLFYKFIETQFSKTIKILRSDNALELTEGDNKEFLLSKGIWHQTTCVDRPQQIGVVERKHKHLLEISRAIRFSSDLPLSFWGDCVLTAAFLINRLPTPLLRNKTPYEMLFNKVPNYDRIRVFGCLAMVYNPVRDKDKFIPRGIPCIFIGYPLSQKGYKVYDIIQKKAFVSRDVKFHETVFPCKIKNFAQFIPSLHSGKYHQPEGSPVVNTIAEFVDPEMHTEE